MTRILIKDSIPQGAYEATLAEVRKTHKRAYFAQLFEQDGIMQQVSEEGLELKVDVKGESASYPKQIILDLDTMDFERVREAILK